MTAYLIVDITVRDEERYAGYRDRVTDQIRQYGGEDLGRGGRIERLEGDLQPRRVGVVEIESVAAAKKWWGSEDYAEHKAIRKAATGKKINVPQGGQTPRTVV